MTDPVPLRLERHAGGVYVLNCPATTVLTHEEMRANPMLYTLERSEGETTIAVNGDNRVLIYAVVFDDLRRKVLTLQLLMEMTEGSTVPGVDYEPGQIVG